LILELKFGDVGVLGEPAVGERVAGGGGGGLMESSVSFGLFLSLSERSFTPCSMDFGFTVPQDFCKRK